MFIVRTHALHCLYDIQVEFLANILYPAYITICAVSYDSPAQFVYSHANICNYTSNVHDCLASHSHSIPRLRRTLIIAIMIRSNIAKE